MESILEINKNIYRLTVPFKDVYTTVYLVKTHEGVLLFDTASCDEDVENYILPFLDKLGITAEMLKYVFVSHKHRDHSGGLNKLMKKFSDTVIISVSPKLREEYSDYNMLIPEDNDTVLDVLKIITVPGHTKDSSAVYDTRTKTLITGDCLQLYGLYGSGKWGSNISFPDEYIKAIEKLRKMDIEHILTAHDYHPYGYSYVGKEAVLKALDACTSPLNEIKVLIYENPYEDDEQIANMYNSLGNPAVGEHVVCALRK